jgi:hypothetical protein
MFLHKSLLQKSVYFLPGHGGRISNGLGQELSRRGYEVVGRETFGDFKRLDFKEQIEIIAEDLRTNFLNNEAKVIANSYGAYLLLSALVLLKPFIGKILLLSPIVGEFNNEDIQLGFIPPYAKKLLELASDGKYPLPLNCEIHVGSEDWQSNPQNVLVLAKLIQANVTVVPDKGHNLSKKYVSDLLDRWL